MVVLPKPGEIVDGWEIIRDLGQGGQGSVFLARSPERVAEIRASREAVPRALSTATGVTSEDGREKAVGKLVESLELLMRRDPHDSLGALKVFNFAGPKAEAAQQRLEREVEILQNSSDPAVVRLLHAKPKDGWMITAYQDGGTVESNVNRWKGNVVAAIRAILPIVNAVDHFHKEGVIHRDIKPTNIFVAADGHLLLGDFGIVFNLDERGRLTKSQGERVGPGDWMAPWANVKKRLDDPNPTFDVFPLGKVLWAMISGEPMLPYWWFDHDEYNLERLFPEDPAMPVVNSQILSKCIVEREESCIASASLLIRQLERTLTLLEHGGELLVVGQPRPCRVCGVGTYELMWLPEMLAGEITYRLNVDRMKPHEVRDEVKPLTIHSYRCKNCGHIQLFHFPPNDPPAGWVKPFK